jgi:hypothetical protein
MKCPYCGESMSTPNADKVSAYIHGIKGLPEVDVVVISCSKCGAILGAVNPPQSS